MKKVKLLSLFLAVLMLCGTVTLFASCGGEKEGILELSKDVIEVDVTDYTVVYGETQGANKYTATFKEQMQLFAQKLGEATGLKFSANEFKRTRSKAEDKEILIGATEREESKKALSEIDGDGFIVKVTDKKIVIVGTSNLFTLMGVTYFTERYLNGGGKVLTLNETMAANNVGVITLVDSTVKNKDAMDDYYYYVYSESLGITPNAYATISDPKLDSEYPLFAIEEIQKKMSELSGIQQKLFTAMKKTDKEVADKEVLVGLTSRPESKEALSSITTSEFIVAATDKKIAVNAWSEATMKLAFKAYLDLMTEGYKEADGKKVVEIPENFRLIGRTTTEWITDFPKPEGEGISLYNTQDANDGALQYLYTGEGVTRAAFDAYCKTLLSQGFKLYTENEVEGSVFKTFTSTAKDMSLYVAYNAYTHKDEYDDYDWTIIKKIDNKAMGEGSAYDYDPCIRLVSAPLKTSYLPEEKLFKKQPYEKVTDTRVTTMPIYSTAVGLSYIITLEDGSFIVFDGGGVNTNGVEHDILWNTLVALHTEVFGSEPTTANPVHISAWVLTHVHWDHYTAFNNMAKKYGGNGKLKMDYMIANTASADSCYLWNEETAAMTPDKINSLKNNIKDGFTYIKAMTGQKFNIVNVEIEVLTTWMDLNPITPANGNNTNTVLRFTISNKDSASQKVTQIWTGDANRWQSRFMCAMYGDYLKSDMVNIAHHGNAGCEIEFYDKVSPTVVWWPHNANSAQNYVGSDKNKGYMYEVDQHICNDIANVKYIFTSGAKKAVSGITQLEDGPYTTLVLTKNGPDYENIYNVMKGNYLNKDATLGYYSYTAGMIEACVRK